MKKIISKNLYIRSLKELIYTAVIMMAVGIAILFMKHNNISQTINNYMTKSASYNPSDISLFFTMIFGSFALSNVSLWFTKDKKNADYVYSLPYTKGQIYTSKFAAVFTMQLAISLIIILFGVFVSLGFIGKITFIGDMMIVLLNAMIVSIVVISAMFVSASITGKALSTSLLAVFLVAIPMLPFISKMSVVAHLLDENVSNMYLATDSIYIIPNFLYAADGYYGGLWNITPIILTLILGIAYAGFGYFLFTRRSGELTGTHTKNTGLHLLVMAIIPSFTVYWLAVTTSIGIGVMTAEVKTIVLFVLLAFMFAVLYEVVVNRTLKKITQCFLVLVCSIIFVSAMHFPVAAKAKYDMERNIDYSEVESINIINDKQLYFLT